MRYPLLVSALALVLTACNSGNESTKQDDTMEKTTAAATDVAKLSEMDKISYAIGQDQARAVSEHVKRYNDMGIKLDTDMIQKGSADFFAGKEGLSDEEMKKQFTTLQEKYKTVQEAKQKEESAANIEAGNKYLEQNKAKEDVQVTETGLQYRVIAEGEGDTPTDTDRVKVHYKGTLINGEEFDSSYSRKKPMEFGVNQVIAGWTEGLQLMQEGAKYEFVIPSELAYGDRNTGRIPPNSVLVFEVELLEVLDSEKGSEKEAEQSKS